MMARVEGMPLEALEHGLDWNWQTFGEFLDLFEGNVGVNAGFMVGHSAIRRLVMGHEHDDPRCDLRRDRRHGRCVPRLARGRRPRLVDVVVVFAQRR